MALASMPPDTFTQVRPPVFIAGSGGSGTTLLRLMLNAHPSLSIPPESNFVTQLWKQFRHREPFTASVIDEIAAYLETCPEYHQFGLDRSRVMERWRALAEPTLANVLHVVYLEHARRFGKSRWGDKTPGYIEQLPRLNALFPACLVIHLIRDGRDAALSMVSRGVGPASLYDAAKEWNGRVVRGRRDGVRLLGPSRYRELRYERLVSDPRSCLAEVCAFIGEPMDERMLEYHRKAAEQIPSTEHDKHKATSRPVTTSQVARWSRELTLWQILTIQGVCGRTLRLHGYAVKQSALAWLVYPLVAVRRTAERVVGLQRKWRRSLAKRLRRRSFR